MTRGDKSEKYDEFFQKKWILCYGTCSDSGTAEASAKDAAAAENESAEVAEDEPEADTEEAEMAGNVLNAGYSSENVMSWPVRGEVIMDYSMDKTIYYPTLQEYKCNPSILIQSEEGTDVAAAFSGTVADVYHDAQLGTVVEMSLGNGYEAYYGQLESGCGSWRYCPAGTDHWNGQYTDSVLFHRRKSFKL